MIQELHERFRDMPKISPVLVQKYAKTSFEMAFQLYEKIEQLRNKEGLNRKKWERIK